MKNSSIALIVIAVVIIVGLVVWFSFSPSGELKVGESQYVVFANNNLELKELNPPASMLESWGVPANVASMLDGNMGNLLFGEEWGVTFKRVAENSWEMNTEILSGQLQGLKLHCIFAPKGTLTLAPGSSIGNMQYTAQGASVNMQDAIVVALFNPLTGEGPGIVSDWEVLDNSYVSTDTTSAPIEAGVYDIVIGIVALPK